MRKFVLTSLASVFALGFWPAHAIAEQTSSLSCPTGYALSIDRAPPPMDDAVQPAQPKTATEKEQEEAQAKAAEMSRWHCVPLRDIQQNQKIAE